MALSYDEAVKRWARKWITEKYPITLDFGLYGRQRQRQELATVDLIDWDAPVTLDFEYEEPYQYSEYTGGGGTGEVYVQVYLLDHRLRRFSFGDLEHLDRTTALPDLIAAILKEATDV